MPRMMTRRRRRRSEDDGGDEAPQYHSQVPELPIYMDHHATTPVDPRVVETMLPFFSENFGNPASLTHEHGRRASNAVEDARFGIARFFGVQPNEVYFTAGATESNNIALNLLSPGDHLITSAMEHKSIVVPAKRLSNHGIEVTLLTPDAEGFIDPDELRSALRLNTKLVSIEAANGEIGTLQSIDALGSICRQRGVLFHSDITQAAFSAHKLYGPKGIGGMIVRRGIRIEPVMLGGGQEKGARSGTVNVPGAVGMVTAFRIRDLEMAAEGEWLTGLRNILWDRVVAEVPGASVNGPRERRLPGNLNVSFERVESDSVMMAMRHFSLSSGSACSSAERSASPVLTAIGVPEALAYGSIRFGLGKTNTKEHVDLLIDDLKRNIGRLREISAA
jgi:cysteine desulfurase